MGLEPATFTGRLLKYSTPLLPMRSRLISESGRSSMNPSAVLKRLALKLPHRPLSEVISISTTLLVSGVAKNGCVSTGMFAESEEIRP
jgi:hypothetical protein